MNRRFFLALLVAALLAACSTSPTRHENRIVILHTNDMHGRVYPNKEKGGLSALAATIKRIRTEEEARGARVFVVDCGDFFQGTPEGNLTRGRMIVEIMNEIGYDAACVGNHELDYGQEVLRDLAIRAHFPLLAANMIQEKTGRPPEYLRKSVEIDGVVFVGVITPTTPSITPPAAHAGLTFEDPAATVLKYPGAIVLSHCGPEIERHLQGRFIIGGHSHDVISEPGYQQAGSNALHVGYIVLGDAPEQRLITVEQERDPAVDAIIARYAPDIDAVMNEEVGELTAVLDRNPRSLTSSPLGNHLCDLMRDHAQADVALHNRTGIRADLPAGIIRVRDVYQVSPFGNTVAVLDLTGDELLNVLEFSVSKESRYILECSGLEFEYDSRAPPEQKTPRITWVKVGGQPLQPSKIYRVATNSFLAAGGDGHGIFPKGAKRRDTFMDLMVLQRDFLKAHRPYTYEFQNRIHLKQ